MSNNITSYKHNPQNISNNIRNFRNLAKLSNVFLITIFLRNKSSHWICSRRKGVPVTLLEKRL